LVLMSLSIHLLSCEISCGLVPKNKDNNCRKKSSGHDIVHPNETSIPRRHSSRNDISSESCPGYSDTRIIHVKHERESQGWQQLIACVHGRPDVSHACKSQEYFDRKATRRVSYPVYSPKFPPYDNWFHADAKEQMKGQVVTDEDDLEAS
jgi:hypothetical protein